MKELTSRERLTRLFNGQEIDRTPIWLLAPYHHVDFYADIYDLPSYERLVPYIDRYCDTFDRRTYDTGVAYNANPEIKRTKRTEKTQKEVADLMGISQSYISRLEKRIMVRLRREISRQIYN